MQDIDYIIKDVETLTMENNTLKLQLTEAIRHLECFIAEAVERGDKDRPFVIGTQQLIDELTK